MIGIEGRLARVVVHSIRGACPSCWVVRRVRFSALYWSVMTMTTVGYGDVHVSTTAERLYAMVCMMLGAFLFAYLLGHTQHLLSHLEDASSEIQVERSAEPQPFPHPSPTLDPAKCSRHNL